MSTQKLTALSLRKLRGAKQSARGQILQGRGINESIRLYCLATGRFHFQNRVVIFSKPNGYIFKTERLRKHTMGLDGSFLICIQTNLWQYYSYTPSTNDGIIE